MKLVLQCAMCGTHHPVGTTVCSTCRASGVAQLRLMFECQSCGRLDISPTCGTCPCPAHDPLVLDLDEGLIVAEEVTDDAGDGPEGVPLELGGPEEEVYVVDLSEGGADLEDLALDLDEFEFDDGYDVELGEGDGEDTF